MIHIENITKSFGLFPVLKDFSLTVEPGHIYGVVGYNGAGKTTLLKTLCGIYRPEKGKITLDDKIIYEEEDIKKTFFMVQDEPLFLPQATLKSMEKFYRGYYPEWSHKTFLKLSELFGLDSNKRINGFSKGMQRQASIIIGLSTHPQYLLLDESFDGLDLSKRNLLKNLLFSYLKIKGTNIIISSHNLKELEGICDYVAMIKDSSLHFCSSVEQMHRQKVKLRAEFSEEDIDVRMIKEAGGYNITGEKRIFTFLCDAGVEEIKTRLSGNGLLDLDSIPLTLEEVFLEYTKEEEYHDFSEIFE